MLTTAPVTGRGLRSSFCNSEYWSTKRWDWSVYWCLLDGTGGCHYFDGGSAIEQNREVWLYPTDIINQIA